jgi:F-type H+-transporting ATPase subunit delta
MRTTKRTRRGARRLFRACLAAGLLDEGRARHVAGRVAGSRRRGSLAILSHFCRLVRLDQESHSASVESATPLPAEFRARVEAGLRRTYGAGVSMSFVENPALIGGMRVKVGSDVYDGSIRTALAALQERFR